MHNPMLNVLEIPSGLAHPLAGARLLQLDFSGNIHSLYRPGPGPHLTHGYYDILATLPGLVPNGPLAILGLGAGTLAHLVHALYPKQLMEGWELDPAVVHAGREYMGLRDVEEAGVLVSHVGDALSVSDGQAGRFTGVAVDIFSEGTIPPVMTEAPAWQGIKSRLQLQPGCRVMANLGHAPLSRAAQADGYVMMSPERRLGQYRALQALEAMLRVFGEGQVSVLCTRNLEGSEADSNCIAVTGPSEGFQEAWQAAVPPQLQYLKDKYSWRKCEELLSEL